MPHELAAAVDRLAVALGELADALDHQGEMRGSDTGEMVRTLDGLADAIRDGLKAVANALVVADPP